MGTITLTRRSFGRLAATGLAAAALTGTARAADFSFRLGHPLQPTDAVHTAMLSFAANVKKRSNGRVEIQVFPADELGVQKEVGEMLVQGGNVMQLTDYLFLGEWVPDSAILQAPFLLNSYKDWYALARSDWMADLEKRLAEKHIYVMSNNNYFGSRSIIGPKAIRAPKDIAGQTLREAAAPMYVKMAESWGARPVTMGFAETYTGLSQGVVDFVECPPPTMVSSKFTELRKTVSLTRHMIDFDPVTVNTEAFRRMPEDLQKIVKEEAVKAGDLMTKLKLEAEDKVVNKLKSSGITVVEDIDRKAFREASQSVYQAFPKWSPDLARTVRGILGQS